MTNKYQMVIPIEDLQNQSIKEFVLNEDRPFTADEKYMTLYYNEYNQMLESYDYYYGLLTTIMELEDLYCKEM